MTTSDTDLLNEQARLGSKGRILLGLFLWGQMALQVLGLMFFWPEATRADATLAKYNFLGCPITQEIALIMSIAILGAMGGSTHALSSFARFAGNRELVRSWVWWYLLRAPIGIALAIVIYFVVRGGLLTAGGSTSGTGGANPYGLGAIAALAGLCSESATMKLSEVFDALFKPNRAADKDTITTSQAPTIKSLAPASVTIGSQGVVTINGAGFAQGDLVLVGSETLKAEVVSDAQARITLTPTLTASASDLPLRIKRPQGAESNTVTLKVA
jgi:hypothetical protein